MKANKIKKVLIAMDYDPTSKKVAEEGFLMAKSMSAETFLLHVSVSPAMYSSASATMGVWQMDPINTLETSEIMSAGSQNFLDKAKRHLGSKLIKTMLKEGDFATMILEAATEINADCIVMGSHSQKWLEKVLMGSVTEEVLRKTTIPMYIIPKKKRD